MHAGRDIVAALLTGLVLLGGILVTGAASADASESGEVGDESMQGSVHWSLADVDAVAADDVWAVGDHNGAAVIKKWDGMRWRSVATPAGTKSLYDIDAVSATDIWAVGLGRVLHWDGSRWTTIYAKDYYFEAVAAIGADDVWVVGLDGGGQHSVKVHWDGTRWSDFGTGDAAIGYNGIAAVSADDVWAAGTRNFGVESVLEHWNGHDWKTFPSMEGVSLNDVAAVSTSDVWFVGQNYPRALVLHWDGSRVSSVHVPTPHARSPLLAVNARSATDIWAVGSSEDRRHGTRPLIEHWDGNAWSIVTSPGAGHHSAALVGVVAVNSEDAWAVGYRREGNRSSYSMTAHWDGTAWTRIS